MNTSKTKYAIMPETMTAAEFRRQHKGYDSERKLQQAVCDELDLHDVAYFAIPNGQMRTGHAMEPGMQSGVPDLCIPVPTDEYAGLYVEMKQPGKYTRPSQREWLSDLTAEGYACRVCRSVDEVLTLYWKYIGHPGTERLTEYDLWPEQR